MKPMRLITLLLFTASACVHTPATNDDRAGASTAITTPALSSPPSSTGATTAVSVSSAVPVASTGALTGTGSAPTTSPSAPPPGGQPTPCSAIARSCSAVPSPTTTIAAMLQSAKGGAVVVEGAVTEGDRRCTNSVPPSCASSLFLTEIQSKGSKPSGTRIRLGNAGQRCLKKGQRYRVEGTHQVEQSRWGDQHKLHSTGFCQLP